MALFVNVSVMVVVFSLFVIFVLELTDLLGGKVASLSQVVGDQNKSATILEEKHEHTIEKDHREKKEKSEDWQEVTKKKVFLCCIR